MVMADHECPRLHTKMNETTINNNVCACKTTKLKLLLLFFIITIAKWDGGYFLSYSPFYVRGVVSGRASDKHVLNVTKNSY